jgi:hypothetical protein
MGCGPPKRALVHRSWTLKARASGSGAQLIRLITSFGCAGTDCHRVSHTHAGGRCATTLPHSRLLVYLLMPPIVRSII